MLDEFLPSEGIRNRNSLVIGATEQVLAVLAPRHCVHATPVNGQIAVQSQGLDVVEAICGMYGKVTF